MSATHLKRNGRPAERDRERSVGVAPVASDRLAARAGGPEFCSHDGGARAVSNAADEERGLGPRGGKSAGGKSHGDREQGGFQQTFTYFREDTR